MTEPLTPEELQAMRERHRKTTQANWVAEGLGSEGYTIKVDVHGSLRDVWDAVGFSGYIGEIRAGRDWQELCANAIFAAQAHQDMPRLIDEVERLQREKAELQRTLDEYVSEYNIC